MADGGKKPSFWETIPGVITAIAGLITALATLITALYTAKIIGQHEEPTKKEAGKEHGEANKPQKDAPAENQDSVPEAAAKEPIEAKQLKQQGNTITDTASGLMWKHCAEGLSGVNCEKGKTEKYTWDDAVKRFKHVEYAGYSDWRLPTIDELKTLLYCSKGKDKYGDCNEGSEKPTINQQFFPNTEATWFWSGTPDAGNSNFAWYVFFNYGYFGIGGRHYSYAVRLVRGGQ